MTDSGHGWGDAEQAQFTGALIEQLSRCAWLGDASSRRSLADSLGLPPHLFEAPLPTFRVELAKQICLNPRELCDRLVQRVSWYSPEDAHALVERIAPYLAAYPEAGTNHVPVPQEKDGTNGKETHRLLLPHPLPDDLHHRATTLLAQVSGIDLPELREHIGHELGIPVPREPATVLALFKELLEYNAPPDKILPCVVLVEWTALRLSDETAAQACRAWAEEWARSQVCLPALERRRERRENHRADPDIPRCLLIMVEPDEDSGDITVRYWINGLAGTWAPRAGDLTVTRLDGLSRAVENALVEGEHLWDPARPDADSEHLLPPYVEFILPYRMLNHDVARLEIGAGGPGATAIGPRYCVHLRSLDRMRIYHTDPITRNRWRSRWRELHRRGPHLQHWAHDDGVPLEQWTGSLAHHPHGAAPFTALALDAPCRGSSGLTALKRAIAEGFGLALWDRRGGLEPRTRETLAELLNNTGSARGVPRRIQAMRVRAEADVSGEAFLGRHVACFWDDPERVVDCQSARPTAEEAFR
ncbi:hypothetical protein ACIBI4_02850 [Streptomyces sp. NPDC050418]|uniref:VMAP-C domain-containing protein n=1 Tax=Streptomyces sp. NPDC050418 TaxID=3365612 RepID=UPI0037B40392